jgi:hypothetical protein
MKRREFLGLVSGAAVLRPLPALAQQAPLPVVGFLNSASADGYASMAAAFKRGLKDAGYVEGQNVTIEYRWANNQPRLCSMSCAPEQPLSKGPLSLTESESRGELSYESVIWRDSSHQHEGAEIWFLSTPLAVKLGLRPMWRVLQV